MSQLLKEIEEAPAAVSTALGSDEDIFAELAVRLKKLNPHFVTTIARGSSDHGATYASYLVPLCTGRPVASLPLSVSTVLNAPLRLSNEFVLGISQSGESPDLIKCMQRARAAGAFTAAILNNTSSTLSKEVEIVIPQHANNEKSIAATKSVICTFTAIARLCAIWSEDTDLLEGLARLPETLRNAYQEGKRLASDIISEHSNVYVLSRALGLSAAQEVALKLKEICGVHAEAFSAAEVRHGPKEIVDGSFVVVALALPGSGAEDVLAAAQELKAQGAKVLVLGSQLSGAMASSTAVLPMDMDFRLAPIVALQVIYPWLVKTAQRLGRNPDVPRMLTSKVVKTV